MDKNELRTEKTTLSLKVFLTEQEITAQGRELAKISGELDEIAAEEKDFRAQIKAKREAALGRHSAAATLINNGYLYKPVECKTVFDTPETGQKTTTRTDTGEVIKTERMTPAEMNRPLFPAPKPDEVDDVEISAVNPETGKKETVKTNARKLKEAADALK